jgi:hypothetical protein
VLLKAADHALRGGGPLWAVGLAAWTAAGLLLVAGRDRRALWLALALGGAALCAEATVELRWQHTVLLVGVALGAAVARDAPERLLLWRVQVSVLYGAAALAKLNLSFLGGGTLAVSLPLLPPPGVLVAASVATVLVEAVLAVSPWVPRLRTPALLIGVLLHGSALLLAPDGRVALRLVFFGGTAVVLLAVSAGRLAPVDSGRPATR